MPGQAALSLSGDSPTFLHLMYIDEGITEKHRLFLSITLIKYNQLAIINNNKECILTIEILQDAAAAFIKNDCVKGVYIEELEACSIIIFESLINDADGRR